MSFTLRLTFQLLLGVLMIGTMIAQDQPDPRRWSIDPRMTNLYPVTEPAVTPQAIPNFENPNKRDHVYYTPKGTFTVAPNFRVHPSTIIWQSEVPITRHPTNPNIMFASSNAVRFSPTTIGEGMYLTSDGGVTWFGSDTTAAAPITGHSGDPAPAIGPDGTLYQSYIISGGMGASYSTNMGQTWANTVTLATGSQDKNHTFVDNTPGSPYFGRAYVTWSLFSTSPPPAVVSYSTNGGAIWTAPINVLPVASGHYHQGVNGAVGPNGVAYIAWQNPVSGTPFTGDFMGFAKSTDGGATWTGNNNVYDCNGIRGTITQKAGIRTNDFPSMAIDMTNGSRRGWIYIVAAETNLPPAGTDRDIVMHKSTDGGTTWSPGIRVNQDPLNNGKIQYMPWMCVDENGGVNVIYYDDRNTASDSAEVYVSRSVDGGNTFTDILVSDHRFKPAPIPGLAGGYQGDYIGITSGNAKLWPYWADNSSGIYQAWITSVAIADPIDPNPPDNVTAFSDFSTPTSMFLKWKRPTTLVNGTPIGSFVMRIKRNGVQIAERPQTDTTFTDTGLIDGTEYNYIFQTRLTGSDSLSNEIQTSWMAGGAKIPAAPTAVAVTGTSVAGYKIKWRNPSRQIDGTRLDDLAGIRIYRDGSLIATLTRTSADTSKLDSTSNLPPAGFHTYYVTAIDNEAPVNESAQSNSAGTPMDLPLNEQFTAQGIPNTNVWVTTNTDVNDGGLNEPSAPYSLNLNGMPTANADNIESRPIDLTGRQGGGVALAYLYQPGGTGDKPEATDSLIVEFQNNLGTWVAVRAYPGIGTAAVPDFAFEAIGIDGVNPAGGTFFYNGFKFRFRSRGTASATLDDDWFVDDVFFGVPSGVANIGASSVVSPAGQVSNNVAINPVVRVLNASAVQAGPYTVNVNITGPGTTYNGSQADSNLAAGAARNVTLSSLFTPNAVGQWTVKAWTRLTGDPNPANDTTVSTFFSVSPLTLPVQESFVDSGVPNPLVWTNKNGRVTPDGTGEPSEPYALNLAGNPTAAGLDTVTSLTINLTGRAGQGVTLAYQQQPQGTGDVPEAADSLVTEALNDQGSWVVLAKLPGAAVRPFAFVRHDLDSISAGGGSFFHSGFKFRFRSRATASTTTRQDDWFVDDVFLGLPNTTPQMLVSPQTITDTVLVGTVDSTSYIFSIRNNNPFATALNYTITESPAVSWLSTSPTAGSVNGGVSTNVRAMINFNSVTPGTYTTRLLVNGNDPGNTVDTVSVNFRVNAAPSVSTNPDSFFFARNFGDSVSAQLKVRNTGLGPLTYNTTVSGGYAGQASDDIGNTENNLTTTSNLMRGGVVSVTTTVQLIRIRAYLNITTPVELRFIVYENTAATGTFTKVFESTLANSGTGTRFYDSDPVNIVLQAGKFYAVGVNWNGGLNYFWDASAPVPIPISFGTITGGLAGTVFPPPATITQGALTSLYYTQLVTARDRWLTVTTNGSGNVAPGDSATVGFKIRTNQLGSGTALAALVVNNNDPLRPIVSVPVRLDVVTDVAEQEAGIPESFDLGQNYPNPFNPTTTIRFSLPEQSTVSLKIYNLLGQEIATLAQGEMPAAYHRVEWTGRNTTRSLVATGIYFYRFEATGISGEKFSSLKKLILLK